MTEHPRRFPPPWTAEEGETYFVVKGRLRPMALGQRAGKMPKLSQANLRGFSVTHVTHQSCGSNYFAIMRTQCLLRGNKYHTTAWVETKATKLGSLVEIPELGGRLWEIVEIYPYRLTNKQLKTHGRLIAL